VSLRIFLSYAREDEAAVTELYQRLRREGWCPWMDRQEIQGGEDWRAAIERAIRASDAVLVMLSPDTTGAGGVLRGEHKTALELLDERLDRRFAVIPVRLQPCELPPELRHLQWVDLFAPDGWDRLRKALEQVRKPRPAYQRWWPALLLAVLAIAGWIGYRFLSSTGGESAGPLAYRHFVGSRPGGSTAGEPAPPQIGLTVWRLRPTEPTDPPNIRLLVHPEQGAGVSWTPVRVDPDKPLRVGERIRVAIESSQEGHLYVFDSELGPSGVAGAPYLIFPTRRINGGRNRIDAHQLVSLPSVTDTPPYFEILPSRPDAAGEVLEFVITQEPIAGLEPRESYFQVDPAQVAAWRKASRKPAEQAKSDQCLGCTLTVPEAEAHGDAPRLLRHGEIAPQLVYTFASSPGGALWLECRLTLRR